MNSQIDPSSADAPPVIQISGLHKAYGDLEVLKGAVRILDRDRPALIVEGTPGGEIADWLRARGYSVSALPGSSNIIALPAAEPVRSPLEEGAAKESTA